MRLTNKSGLAEVFGVTVVTIAAWLRRGCPFEEKGKHGKSWTFDTAKVAAWREEQAALAAGVDTSKLDHDTLKLRKFAAEAELAEIDLAHRKGELIEVGEALRQVEGMVSAMRARLLNLPTKAAAVLATTPAEMAKTQETIRVEVYAALTEISSDEFQRDLQGRLDRDKSVANAPL